ncbi:MAG TPA: lysyl oxidase family protein [Candidatus Limnocylindria bacterium]|nr:lysyl oxidase family protein [Candidatus Limnocylindria bacterium]
MARTREATVSLALAVTLAMLLAAFVVGTLAPRPADAASARLPNLRMLPLSDWTIQNVGGRRLLRFTTIMANQGPGPFEVRGRRTSRSDPTMQIDQVIFHEGGGSHRASTGAVGKYAGDGHDHWHVQRIMTYELYRVDNPATVRGGAKTGFCFLDTTPWRLGLPHARQSPYYQEEWCGGRQALSNRVGISVGWGDRYPWDFAFQWIDITGLPSGRYVVRSTVDISDWYRETNDYDNCRWTRIRIPSTGSRVEVLDSGADCGRDAITPAHTFPGARTYDPPRTVSIQPGTYTGRTFNDLGTQLRAKRVTLGDGGTAIVDRLARIPGQAGRWFHVVERRFAGYWLRDSGGVD